MTSSTNVESRSCTRTRTGPLFSRLLNQHPVAGPLFGPLARPLMMMTRKRLQRARHKRSHNQERQSCHLAYPFFSTASDASARARACGLGGFGRAEFLHCVHCYVEKPTCGEWKNGGRRGGVSSDWSRHHVIKHGTGRELRRKIRCEGIEERREGATHVPPENVSAIPIYDGWIVPPDAGSALMIAPRKM